MSFKFGDEVTTPMGPGVVLSVEGSGSRTVDLTDAKDKALTVEEVVEMAADSPLRMDLDGLVEVELHPGCERYCMIHNHMVAADATCPADHRYFRPSDLKKRSDV